MFNKHQCVDSFIRTRVTLQVPVSTVLTHMESSEVEHLVHKHMLFIARSFIENTKVLVYKKIFTFTLSLCATIKEALFKHHVAENSFGFPTNNLSIFNYVNVTWIRISSAIVKEVHWFRKIGTETLIRKKTSNNTGVKDQLSSIINPISFYANY